MIRQAKDLKTEKRENMRGGQGEVVLSAFLSADEMNGKNRLFSRITLAPGCSIGYHEHHGESEIFVVAAGKGLFNDNGEMKKVVAGDVCATGYGEVHGLENTGSEDLELIALVVLKD